MDSYNNNEKTAYFQQNNNNEASTKTNPIKINSGLSLQSLNNLQIPKNPYKAAKYNFPLKASSNFKSSKTSMKSPNKSIEEESKNIGATYSRRYTDITKSNNLNKTNNKSKEKYSGVKSPTSHIFKSYGCHRYHTDLDFNFLAEQKFLKEAISCGREKLNTVSLKSNSPDKYFYENKYSNSQNRFIKVRNTPGLEIIEDAKDRSRSKSKSKDNINQEEISEGELNKSGFKDSKNILNNILDLQFSVNSPSKMKIYQNEINQMKNDEFKSKMLNVKKIENKDDQNNSQTMYSIFNNKNENFSKDKIYVDDDARITINLSYIGENPQERLIESLENVLTHLDPIFEKISPEEKLEKLLEVTDDARRGVRLGAIVAIYLILIKYETSDNLKLLILEKVISLLQVYETQEEIFLVACLELCTLFAPCDLLIDNIGLICMFITDFNFPRLQKATFNLLMKLEYEGIKTLVELASKDFQEYQRYILSSLLKTPHIQKLIIIKALINDLYSNNPDRRHSALAALNRMYDLVAESEALTVLSKFFHDSKVEKIFLSSTIRTSGEEGEKILLQEIKNNKDFSVRVAIASVLSFRMPKYPKYLDIRLDKNDTYAITRSLPGSFCTYYGRVSPYVLEVEEYEQNNLYNKEYLEVSTRDFLASLQRMLSFNYNHSNPRIVHLGKANLLDELNLKNSKSDIIAKYTPFFEMLEDNTVNVQENELLDENGKKFISEDMIRALCFCLRDYSTAVRDTAASSLGQIGLPEALLSINYLVEGIKDEDVNVKSKIIWAIGRISQGCDNSVIQPIVEALKSNMWKVKCACFYTLSQFGFRCAKLALPALIKLLKESAINKQTIAETIVKLGNDGESVLLNLMNTENDSNYKLKSSVAKALALSNVNSPNIDFIVECIFKASNSTSNLIRKNALFAIRVLAEKSDERVTYLKRKNIIPFYYDKLLDKDQTIQAYAISCIKSLGPQGELIFIEGLTKDINPIIRINCSIGLASMGPHTLRTLLIGLHDEHPGVRKTVEKEIMEKFNLNSILDTFSDKISQKKSLKIAIRDILEKNIPINNDTKTFFSEILLSLEKENYAKNENMNNNNSNINNNMNNSFKERDQDINFNSKAPEKKFSNFNYITEDKDFI